MPPTVRVLPADGSAHKVNHRNRNQRGSGQHKPSGNIDVLQRKKHVTQRIQAAQQVEYTGAKPGYKCKRVCFLFHRHIPF